jgi:hypothetical protein
MNMLLPASDVGCTFVVELYIDPPPSDVCISLSESSSGRPQALRARSKGEQLGVFYVVIISVPSGTCGEYILTVCIPQPGGSCSDDPLTMDCSDFPIFIDCGCDVNGDDGGKKKKRR